MPTFARINFVPEFTNELELLWTSRTLNTLV